MSNDAPICHIPGATCGKPGERCRYELSLLAADAVAGAVFSLGFSLDSLLVLLALLLVVLLALLLVVLLALLPESLRLSLIYQPEPLNTIPTGWNTRRTEPLSPQIHVSSGASLKLWKCSNCLPHLSQAYTYVGIAEIPPPIDVRKKH
jgi:hypothetical protein